ncbi:MAG: hypothetical protein U0527_14905 [Candidatus Eisenbacteria bacterium]
MRVAVVPLLLALSLSAKSAAADPCGELLLHGDGSWETAYGWPYWYSPPPDYGAFAECYSGEGELCALVLWGTDSGVQDPNGFDAFVWSDGDNGEPGTVICSALGLEAGGVPTFPMFKEIDVPLGGCCVSGSWWVGFRGAWGGPTPGFYIGGDYDGPGQGCPMTKIAPGLGYPEGWQSVTVLAGEPTKSLAIGAMIRSCAPVPMAPTTWGRVKSLYTTTAR